MTPGIRSLALSLFASSLALSACAADADFDKADQGPSADEVRVGGSALDLGTLAVGASREVDYRNPPRFRALRFRAAAGDRVEVWARSTTGGDAMLWVTDASRELLASNDDAAPGTLDARVTVTLRRAGEYTILLRDYHLRAQRFTVSLSRAGATSATDFTSCATDRDCVAVSRGGCCTGWQRVAVNASRADAWAAANACTPPYPPCAPPPSDLLEAEQSRVAVCNTERRQCEMVAPSDIRCGGRTLNPRACPAGWACVGDGLARDIPGRCAPGCVGGDGVTYAPGQSFSDGCNTCSCQEGGRALCTRRACSVCTVNGRTYEPGASFYVACNTCTCQPTGAVACTAIACSCDPARETNRRYVGDPESCTRIRFACMAGETMFHNACGCGCER